MDDLESVVQRYLPDPELLALCGQMRGFWNRSMNLMEKISEKSVQQMAQAPPQGAEVAKFKHVMNQVDINAYTYSGKQLYTEVCKESPYRKAFATPLDWGSICFAKLRAGAYLAMAKVIHGIRRKIEGYYQEVSITDLIGPYSARVAGRHEAAIYRGASKFVEERSVMQLLACFGLSPEPIAFEFVEEYVRKGMELVGLTYAATINALLTPYEEQVRAEFYALNNDTALQMRLAWMEAVFKSGESVRKLKLVPQPTYAKRGLHEGIPVPFFEVPNEYWKESVAKEDTFPVGLLSGEVPLVPVSPRNLPVFGEGKQVPVNEILGPLGSGKTVMLDTLACYRVQKGYIVFRPNIPRSQSLSVVLPLLPVTRQLEKDHAFLTKTLRIAPKGYAAVFFTVAENEGQIDKDAVYTKHDKIIFVKKLSSFSLDWKTLIKPILSGGYLVARELRNPDLTHIMRATLFRDFFQWREKNKDIKMALQSDEVWEMVRAVYASSEEAQVAQSVFTAVKDIRGLNLAWDFATTRSTDINPGIVGMITTNGSFFFGYMPETSQETWRSPRSQILGMVEANISDGERQFINTVRKIMSNVPIQDNFLFFWVHNRRLRLVKACLPPHCPEVTDVNIAEVFRKVEAETGEQVMVPYKEVPRFEVGAVAREAKPTKKRDSW